MSDPMNLTYSELDETWVLDKAAKTFTSPEHPTNDDQRLIFAETIGDGSISAQISVKKAGTATDRDPKVASILFRYQDRSNYYFAGLGAFGTRLAIGKRLNGQAQSVFSTQTSSFINYDHKYNVRVEFKGNRIEFFDNGVPQFAVTDNSFTSGNWGLATWKTVASFGNLSVNKEKPICFLVMPFAQEFDKVYEVIRSVVEECGFTCERADTKFVTCPIIDDIKDKIAAAKLVIIEFTGKNTNVYFEAGYADALEKPVIYLTQAIADLTFDVKHNRTFQYPNSIGGDAKLKEILRRAIEETTGAKPMSK